MFVCTATTAIHIELSQFSNNKKSSYNRHIAEDACGKSKTSFQRVFDNLCFSKKLYDFIVIL